MAFSKLSPVFLFIVLISACSSEKLKMEEAKKCVSEYMDALKNKDFSKATIFFISVNEEQKKNKLAEMKKLEEVLGTPELIELIDSAEYSDDMVKVQFATKVDLNDSTDFSDEESNIQLTYKIKNSKLESKEKFVIVLEDGLYKIKEHQVRSGVE